MEQVPLLLQGASTGTLTAEREALYTCFTARCPLPDQGLWCAWVVGDRGELRLGILEPEGDAGVIQRRFSDRMTAPLGKLLRGEARLSGAEVVFWRPLSEPERLFRTPWLRRQLREVGRCLFRQEGSRYFLALPYDKGNSFPLIAWFCFASIREIEDRRYAVYAVDEKERPVFSGDAPKGDRGADPKNSRKI